MKSHRRLRTWTCKTSLMYLPLVKTPSLTVMRINDHFIWPIKDPGQSFWRTVMAHNRVIDEDGFHLIEEPDDAFKRRSPGKPQLSLDPQSAADLVGVSIPEGSAVCGHAISDRDPIYLPGHVHMVRVESTGHTDESLLPLVAFLVSALCLRRLKKFYCWFPDREIWFWNHAFKWENHFFKCFMDSWLNPQTLKHEFCSFCRLKKAQKANNSASFSYFLTQDCQSGAAAKVKRVVVHTDTRLQRKPGCFETELLGFFLFPFTKQSPKSTTMKTKHPPNVITVKH